MSWSRTQYIVCLMRLEQATANSQIDHGATALLNKSGDACRVGSRIPCKDGGGGGGGCGGAIFLT